MRPLNSVPEARRLALADLRGLIRSLRRLTACVPEPLDEELLALRRILQAVYKELNQVQHECLVLESFEWLADHGEAPLGATWSWNARQTGDRFDSDLAARLGRQQVLAAKVTTPERPVGSIDRRMASTLQKLAKLQGSKFFFVRTRQMEQRAQTKVNRHRLPITIVRLDVPSRVGSHRQ